MILFRVFVLSALVFLTACAGGGDVAQVGSRDVEISNLGPVVNSPADEFAPGITANGLRMVFTRGSVSRPYNRDFWESALQEDFWSDPLRLPAPINSTENEGAPSYAADGQQLYFASEAGEGSQGSSDIYHAALDGRSWSALSNLGFPVNSDAWDSHPSISPDGNRLYFVSNRDGGVGGLDIWVSEKDLTGAWKVPVNAGPVINTEGDEVSPFIAADGMSLYFASTGHPGLGGTDMFVSRLMAGEWTVPVNLGSPLNSADNDEFFAMAAEGSVVYFASKRAGGFGGLDLYRAWPNPFPPEAVIVLSGVVRDRLSKEPLGASILIVDAASGKVLSQHEGNAYSGEYAVVLPRETDCIVRATAPGYNPEELRVDTRGIENYEERRHDFLLLKPGTLPALAVSVTADVLNADFSILTGAASAPGLTVEEVVTRETMPLLNYVFFDKGTGELPERYARLTRASATRFTTNRLPSGTIERYHHILNILGYRLRENPQARLTLTGTHSGDETQEVAKRRTESVYAYLRDVWGLAEDRVEMLSRGLPEHPSGERTEAGREENRRVEIESDDPAILAPVERISREQLLRPPLVHFFPTIVAEAGLDRWYFTVTAGGLELRSSDGYSSYPDSIVWNWRTPNGSLSLTGDTIYFALSAKDKLGSQKSTTPKPIPVNIVNRQEGERERRGDRMYEKISLILFDFDRAEPGSRNRRLLEHAGSRLKTGSAVVVRGYTDALGEDAYNLTLSRQRASAARELLLEIKPDIHASTEGYGETELLFDNVLPEGRFYCRTVQIVVESLAEQGE